MKGKWGAMMVEGRGKLGGHVFSKNRSGAIVRTKVTPVNPQTAAQLGARNRLTQFSQGWRALSAAAITAWNAAVSDFQGSNVFGDTVSPTGKNLYTRLNINLANIAQPAITLPPQPAGGGSVLAGTAIITAGGVKSIAHSGSTVGNTIQVWATDGVSAGRLFLKTRYRLIDTFAGAAVSPHVFTAEYNTKFGTGVLGTRVGVRLVSVNNATGEAGTASESTTITV